MISSVYKLSNAIAKSPSQLFILLVLVDIGNIVYLRARYLTNLMSEEYIKNLMLTLRPDLEINPFILGELRAVMASSFSTMLLVFIVFNTMMYYFFYKDKEFAIKFVKGYSLMAVLFSIIELFSYINDFSLWFFYLVITIIFYFAVYIKIKEDLREKNQ